MNIVLNSRQRKFKTLLENHHSVSVMGMPGSGISLFLRELADSNAGESIYIDVFALPALSKEGLLETIEHELKKRSSQKQLILYFAGFDQLQPALDAELLQSLHSLARSKENIRLVFGLCISLKKLIPDSLFDSGLRLFGNTYYLAPYSEDELRYLLGKYGPIGWENNPALKNSLHLCGGHFQLLLSLLERNNAASDVPSESINLLFKNLYGHLLGQQRTIVRRISQSAGRVEPDEYLLGIGMVRKAGEAFSLFSPFFANYLSTSATKHLPIKERRLFLLLKKNLGQLVPKQQIMDTIWGDEIPSEWALNALIYRLRKHPAFINKGYTIENHKKLGYVMDKNT